MSVCRIFYFDRKTIRKREKRIHILVFSLNRIIFSGGAIYIHAFGAYFGLAVSMMSRKRDVGKSEKMEASRYTSDIFSLVSTHFTSYYEDAISEIGLYISS